MSEASNKKFKSMKKKRAISNAIVYAVLIIMAIIWLTPFVLIVLESFRVETTMQVGYVIPKQWGLDNYIWLFNNGNYNFAKWYLNTFVIACFVAVINTFMVLCMSYTLSRMRFKGRKALMNMMLVLGMFPGFITVIVLYKVLSGMGLTGAGAVPGLILVYTASSGMGYYIAKGFFDNLPFLGKLFINGGHNVCQSLVVLNGSGRILFAAAGGKRNYQQSRQNKC